MNYQINQIAREIYALEPMRVYDPEIKDFREQKFEELEEGFTELFRKIARYVIEDRKRVVNLEPTIWLQRAKENIVKCNYDKATKCINEAIELIYGKAE